ncbi:MAG: redoxin domain-containing protein [Leptospirales bacterium]|nr:redoxin domain-containing protein [Leptospirales bacterium]
MIRQALVSIPVLFLFAWNSAFAAPTIGAKAPEFILPQASGAGNFDLAKSLKQNKLVVLMFIATKCPFSNAYNERMAKLPSLYQGKGVQFIGINSNHNEPNAEIIEHARTHGLTFPILKDEANRIADLYDAKKTPEVFVIDSQGILRYHGRIDENYQDAAGVTSPDLANALGALLANKSVPAATTKAFGCSIKRVGAK